MAGTQRLLAIAVSFLLADISGGAKPDVLGIIVASNHANLGERSASEGTSVYDDTGSRHKPAAPCNCGAVACSFRWRTRAASLLEATRAARGKV
jgi:hypothetical protein